MYGSIVDNDAPVSLQKFYQNEQPQFLFKASSPFAYISRNQLFSRLFGQLISLGFFGYVLYSFVDFTKFTNISTAVSQLSIDPEIDILGAIIALVVLGGVLKLIYTVILFFLPKKMWFIGTKKQLIISDTKKAESIDWDKFEANPQYIDNFDASSLILKLKADTSIEGTLFPQSASWKDYAHSPIKISPLPNPEIKRLIETFIKNTSTEEDLGF